MNGPDDRSSASAADFVALARFRYGIRRYLRFSEEAIRSSGVTSGQYQLMLALMGLPGNGVATVQEVAEQLLVRHHSAVELIDRAQEKGLVRREPHPTDGRRVQIHITDHGRDIVGRLAAMHRDEREVLLPYLSSSSDDRRARGV
ncbi:MarR family winged helix-turn-helix transcriptional regulator [Gordonia sp. DT218]|uniref:MarR family winged helix-turn-helix transcriptional regulator n=1 Tax=unclassified Gordonia (in: high G+C Gram-positive bacteria) TaxID=2657482 RepID=UPI003CE6BE0E